MKRKIMKIADTTYVVSLPLKWAREHNVKKGDEVEVEISENTLKLSLDSTKEAPLKKEITLEQDGTKRYVESSIINAFKSGFDEIRINYSEDKQLEFIKSALEEVIGLEIIEVKKDYCLLRTVATIHQEELDNLIRRSFLVLLSVSESSLEDIKKKKISVQQYFDLNKTIKKLTTVCKRLLNLRNSEFEGKLFLYLIIREIEKISNEYLYVIRYCAKQEFYPSKETQELLSNVNILLRDFYTMFYEKKLELVSKITHEKDKLLWEDSYKLLKTKKEDEIIIIHHLASIIRRIYDMHGPYLALND